MHRRLRTWSYLWSISWLIALFIPLPIASGAAPPSTPSPPATEEFFQKLHTLADRSLKSQKGCQAYVESLEKIAKPHEEKPDLKRIEPYPNFSAALGVIRKLKSHPGTPSATREAMELILEQNRGLIEGKRLIDEARKLQYFCGLTPYYSHLRQLLESRDYFPYRDEHLIKLYRLVINFARDESSRPGVALLELLFQLDLFDRLLDQHLIRVTVRFAERHKELFEQAKSARDKINASLAISKKRSDLLDAQAFLLEAHETDRLRKVWSQSLTQDPILIVLEEAQQKKK